MKSFGRTIWFIIVAISTFGGLLAYLTVLPDVSIHQYIPLDPKDPFKTIFTVTNDSVFPIHLISLNAFIVDIVDARDNHFSNILIRNNDNRDLGSNKSTSVTIGFEKAFTGYGIPFKKAQIEAVVNYKYLFLSGTSTAKFLMLYNSSGEATWVPID